MSSIILHKFLNYVYLGKLEDVLRLFYTSNTLIRLNKDGIYLEPTSGKEAIKKALSAFKTIQYKVEDVIFNEEIISYKIYLITKNLENQIDFSEHIITNKWKNNKIYEHQHNIITH
ncbi:hypothetical protein [Aquimarina sp. 2201CG5-10]|uniref:hypothetical protein n=1 Tax=Aquimarina callyspongiae TaxID=3098150 RepID=UPI002AB5B00F|nr:hypothetical protein [Aquimarina sp. 2201CG5-10]MDY8137068.1 hypothetical protein [Aquimarina sp. 2201CG5-10]